MKNLVSVIIPVYNIELYIERCIRSVLVQTYTNTEIILVDNNSTDGSRLICENYAREDNRIILTNEEKQGLGPARNRGINFAKGEWICFVDGDDYIHPRYIELMLKTVVENNCLSCQCRYKKVYEDNAEDSYKQEIDYVDVKLLNWRKYFLYIYQHAIEGHTPFGVCCNIYHHSLFEGIRFGELRFAEDSAFTPKIIYAARESRIAVIDNVLYFYFQREGSLLNSSLSMIRVNRFYAKKEAMEFWRSKGEEEMYALFFNDFYSCMIRDFLGLELFFPEQEKKYEFLRDEIEKYYSLGKRFCNGLLELRPGSREFFEKIVKKGNEYIQYGYGEKGKIANKCFHALGINIFEVWDQNPKNNEDVAVVLPHKCEKSNLNILVTIEGRFLHYQLKEQLESYIRDAEVVPFINIDAALRYGIYKKYLPFLLENYF